MKSVNNKILMIMNILFSLSVHASLQGSEHSNVCNNLEILSHAIQDADAFDIQNSEAFHFESVQAQSAKLEKAIYKARSPESLRGVILAILNYPTVFAIGPCIPCIPSKLVANGRFHTNLTVRQKNYERNFMKRPMVSFL